MSTHMSKRMSTHMSTHISTYLSTHMSAHMAIHMCMHVSAHMSYTCLHTHLDFESGQLLGDAVAHKEGREPAAAASRQHHIRRVSLCATMRLDMR